MNALLRLPAVISATGLARPTVYLRIKNGLFVRPVKLSERAVAWPSNEVAAIIAARIAGKSDNEIRELVTQLEQQRLTVA
jgi:prophage regulatory protein